MHPVLPRGYQLVEFHEIDSTNIEAGRRAMAGERGPLWIVAARQTMGRGRYGRPWTSVPGNLYASLLMTDAIVSSATANLSFVAALALFDAVSACLAEDTRSLLRVKWPNDLLIDGAKTSGILLEAVALPGNSAAGLVLGFGVNIRHKPEGNLPYKATCLADHGADESPLDLLGHLATTFDRWNRIWAQGADFGAIRKAWLDRALGVGQSITVKTQNDHVEGVFVDLDEDGALLLRVDGGAVRRILAGDVFFG